SGAAGFSNCGCLSDCGTLRASRRRASWTGSQRSSSVIDVSASNWPRLNEAPSDIIQHLVFSGRTADVLQIGLDTRELLNEAVGVRIVYADERFRARQRAELLHFFQRLPSRFSEIEKANAPVGGMPPPFDETSLFEFVENTNKGDRFDLENFSQSALVETLVMRQISHRLILRA